MKNRSVLTRVLTIIGLLLAVALIASPAMGATDKPLIVKTMKVSVQPEYDDPRIMVTYQGEFKDGSVFPQPVNFPVPLGSEMNMVCALKPPNEDHLCQLYDTQTNSDTLSISYTLPIAPYYLEYYWDGIKGQSDKSFTFRYVSPYAVDSLELDVQQPLKATNFKLAQPYASATSDGQGFKYYRYTFNNVTPGQVISLDASYTKADNKPSVAKKPTNATSGGSASAGGSSAYAVTGIGAALLAVAVFGFMLLRRKPVPAPVRAAPVLSRKVARAEARRVEAQRAHRQEVPRTPMPEPVRGAPAVVPRPQGGGAAFCSQCGTKLPAGAFFCHVCGAKAKGTA